MTGSSQGIGLALARGLGRAGASLVLHGRDTDRLETAVAELRACLEDAQAMASDRARRADAPSRIRALWSW